MKIKFRKKVYMVGRSAGRQNGRFGHVILSELLIGSAGRQVGSFLLRIYHLIQVFLIHTNKELK